MGNKVRKRTKNKKAKVEKGNQAVKHNSLFQKQPEQLERKDFNLLGIVLFLFLIILLSNLLIVHTMRTRILKHNSTVRISIPIFLSVTTPNHININRNTRNNTAIYFGGGPPGSILKVNFNLTNYNPYPINVSLKIKGSVMNWLTLSTTNFTLYPNITQNIELTASIPNNITIGKYNATLIVLEEH